MRHAIPVLTTSNHSLGTSNSSAEDVAVLTSNSCRCTLRKIVRGSDCEFVVT